VAAGKASPQAVWPEYFADKSPGNVPSTGADMSDWHWEKPTEQSFQDDMAAMAAAQGQHFVMPEQEAPPAPPPAPQSLEWT
jgi:hypothetical protein